MKNFFFYFTCVDVLSAWMSVHHIHAGPEVTFNGASLEFQHAGKRDKSQVPNQPGLNREFQVSYTVRLSLCEMGQGGGRGKSLVEDWRILERWLKTLAKASSVFSFCVSWLTMACGSGFRSRGDTDVSGLLRHMHPHTDPQYTHNHFLKSLNLRSYNITVHFLSQIMKC